MAILAVVVSMSSCGGGSSFEGDVKKFGNMRCKAQQLAAKLAMWQGVENTCLVALGMVALGLMFAAYLGV